MRKSDSDPQPLSQPVISGAYVPTTSESRAPAKERIEAYRSMQRKGDSDSNVSGELELNETKSVAQKSSVINLSQEKIDHGADAGVSAGKEMIENVQSSFDVGVGRYAVVQIGRKVDFGGDVNLAQEGERERDERSTDTNNVGSGGPLEEAKWNGIREKEIGEVAASRRYLYNDEPMQLRAVGAAWETAGARVGVHVVAHRYA